MRKFTSSLCIVVILMCSLLIASSCQKPTPTAVPTQSVSDALKKYPEPLTVKFLSHDDGSMTAMPDGVTWDNNVWTDAFLDDLNIKIESVGVATSSNYDQKLSMMLSSNSLPDIFYCTSNTLKTFVLSDSIQGIGQYQDQYTTEDAKKYLFYDGGTALNSCKIDDIQYAIPQLRPIYDEAVNNIAIRTDWLENLGIPEPETWADILSIIEAFATKDPDKNGKDDTYGIGINQESVDGVLRGVSDMQGFFAAYRAYPGRWIDDGAGGIKWGTIQPEVIKPLSVLRDFYKKGYIDPDFMSKSPWDVKKDILAGKIGLSFMAFWGAANFGDIHEDLGDKLKFYPIPSEDGKPTQLYLKNWMTVGTKVVVNKNFANPEVVYKLFSYEVLKAQETGDEYKKLFDSDLAGFIPSKFMIATMGLLPDAAQKAQKEVMKIFEEGTQGTDQVPVYLRELVDNISAFLDGDWSVEHWFAYMYYYGDNSAEGVVNYYIDNDMVTMDRFTGAQTDTMWKKSSVLQWEGIGAYNYIISGEEPIEFFDTFVENWMQKGGEKLINEVNAWWEAEKDQ